MDDYDVFAARELNIHPITPSLFQIDPTLDVSAHDYWWQAAAFDVLDS